MYCSDIVARALKSPPPREKMALFPTEYGYHGFDFDWGPEGRYLAFSQHRSDFVCDTTTDELIHELTGPASHLHSLDWIPDGERLAAGSKGGRVSNWAPMRGRPTFFFDVGSEIFGLVPCLKVDASHSRVRIRPFASSRQYRIISTTAELLTWR